MVCVVEEMFVSIYNEVSSRNSEVIHAGIYYPKDSLKSNLCIKGNRMLYEICEKAGIPCKRVGKWIFAKNEDEERTLFGIQQNAKEVGVDLKFLSTKDMVRLEPNIKATAALFSPTTGIIDSYQLMSYLEQQIRSQDSEVAYNSEFVSCEKRNGVYILNIRDTFNNEIIEISCDILINSGGLHSDKIAHMILKERYSNDYDLHYCKGHYLGYSDKTLLAGSPRLFYPVPEKNIQGLGIHLTVGLDGKVKFGPDTLYIDKKIDYEPRQVEQLIEQYHQKIKEFFPNIRKDKLFIDYTGIRPKLQGPNDPFRDFIIKEEFDKDYPGVINLIGIESPGLTSSLAIADKVEELLADKGYLQISLK